MANRIKSKYLSCALIGVAAIACGGGGSTPDSGAGAIDAGTADAFIADSGADAGGARLAEVTVVPAGGTVEVPSTGLTLTFPAGAVAADTLITVDAAEPPAGGLPGKAFSLGPDGLQFAQPVGVRIAYASLPAETAPETLRVFTRSAGEERWTALETALEEGSTAAAGAASASITHFSWLYLGPFTGASFFVTSVRYEAVEEFPFGGDFGGLAGADEFCMERASAARLPGAWVAYLTTATPMAGMCQVVTGAARIGAGPWVTTRNWQFDALADLNERLDSGGDPRIRDEFGRPAPASDPDVFTGVDLPDRMYGDLCQDGQGFGFATGNCENWTNDNPFLHATVGHAVPIAGESATVGAGIWEYAHQRGCDGGGYVADHGDPPNLAGRIYCFRLP